MLHQIRTLPECPLDRLIDRIADRIRSGQLIERLNLDHCRCGAAHCGCEISASDLLSPDDRLQIVFGLGSGASRFQYIRPRREAICQARFGGLLDSLRIRQACSRSIFLSGGAQ